MRTAPHCAGTVSDRLALCAARHAVRLAPASPIAHIALGTALAQASGAAVAGLEIIPDGLEQARRELEIARVAAERAGDPALAARAEAPRAECFSRTR